MSSAGIASSKLKARSASLNSSIGVAGDPGGDAAVTGTVPGYAEIVQAGVRGRGKDVDLVLVMSGEVPQTMPSATTYMIVAWNLEAAGEAPTAGINAEADQEGWRFSASIDNEIVDYPGTFSIEGNHIILTMPWDFIGGPHEFNWSTAATWYESSGSVVSSSGDNITTGHYPPRKKKKD